MRISALVVAFLSSGLVSATLTKRRSQSAVSFDNPLKIPGDSPLELCPGDHGDDIVLIYQVDLDPNPPQAGQDLQIRAFGVVQKTINPGAYVNITIKYGPIKLLTTKADLCEQIQNVDLSCPVEPGPLEIAKTVKLPGEIPPGKYYVHADAYNDDDESITCLTATVAFGRKAISFAGLEL